jgi:hypothetical protein
MLILKYYMLINAKWNRPMVAQLREEITRDGQALLVAAALENGPVICRVPRETIHALRIYSDIIGREIQLERRISSRSSPPF